jgi:hypothetical protein
MTSESNSDFFPYWRQLALKAAREKDTEKLIALVNELLEEIERDKNRPRWQNSQDLPSAAGNGAKDSHGDRG